jgi:uncharacterized repeat protein (TIGR01451 family)
VTHPRVAPAAAVLLVVTAALWVPAAGAQTPTPAPSPSATPAPSPSGSGSPSATSTPAIEAVALQLTAEPETVEVGHETVLVAQVTNTGGVAAGAGLEVVLPRELELVDAFPSPTTSGQTVTFDLGSLAPGESAVAQVTVRGIEVVPSAAVTAVATSGTATASASVDVMVVVTGASGDLMVTSRTEGVLAQVGSMMRYVVTVTNDGSEDLENVLVVDLAPEELEVVSVDIVDEVEAVQIGESLGRYDIVWNVGSLPAGASVELPWDGRAVRAGDLTAVNSVRGLLGQNETVRSTSRSYLASEGPRDVANPRFEPIEKRVVTFVQPDPVASPQERGTAKPGGALPFTGASPSRYLLAGILFVVAGALLAGGARLAPAGAAKAVVGATLAALVLVACVSGGDDSVEGAGGASPRTFGTHDPRGEEARVKGERIVRGDGEATAEPTEPPSTTPPVPTSAPPGPTPTDAPATSAPPAVAAPSAPPAATAPAEPKPVRVVEVVRIGLEDLPIETLDSRAGDNTVSFGWDESAGGISAASSGTRFVRGGGAELLTDLTTKDGAIVNRLTLTNTHDDVRLYVRGRLVHEVYSGGRLVARLRSSPIDEVLSPGGSVVASFSYLVPTGDYGVEARFVSSQ